MKKIFNKTFIKAVIAVSLTSVIGIMGTLALTMGVLSCLKA